MKCILGLVAAIALSTLDTSQSFGGPVAPFDRQGVIQGKTGTEWAVSFKGAEGAVAGLSIDVTDHINESPGSANVVLAVKDSSGNVIQSVKVTPMLIFYNMGMIKWTPPAPGTYVIRIENNDNTDYKYHLWCAVPAT